MVKHYRSKKRMTRKMRRGGSRSSASRKSKSRSSSKSKSRSKSSSAEDYVNDTCPICFEHLSLRPIITTRCKHTFHEDCLVGWCSAQHDRKTCPVCRADITATCTEIAPFNSMEIFRYLGVSAPGGEAYNNAKAINIIANPKFDPNVRAKYRDLPEQRSLFWHLVSHLEWKLLEELLKRPDLVIPVADAADHAGSDKVRKLLIKYKKVPKALKGLMM